PQRRTSRTPAPAPPPAGTSRRPTARVRPVRPIGSRMISGMAVIPESVRAQLKARFELRLSGPVHLTLYTRPGSSRLILPAGLGCATCEDARQLAELLRDAAPEKVTLDVVDTSRDPGRADADQVDDVPTIALGANANTGRIRFQGLPTGTEFPA